MSERHLHVMAEWGDDTFPVWERTPGFEPGPIDPVQYGLTWDLILALQAWNREWPEHSDMDAWKQQARELAARLQAELGREVHVTFDDH